MKDTTIPQTEISVMIVIKEVGNKFAPLTTFKTREVL